MGNWDKLDNCWHVEAALPRLERVLRVKEQREVGVPPGCEAGE